MRRQLGAMSKRVAHRAGAGLRCFLRAHCRERSYRALGHGIDRGPAVRPRAGRRSVRTHRSGGPSPHRRGFSRQARRALFRLYLLPRRVPNRAAIDLARARPAWRRGRGGAAFVHHRRSGARHAGAACRFRLGVSPATDRLDRFACRDPENRDRLQDVLRQKQHGDAGRLFGRPQRIHLSGRQGRAVSRLPAARSSARCHRRRHPRTTWSRSSGTHPFSDSEETMRQEKAADAERAGTGGRKRSSRPPSLSDWRCGGGDRKRHPAGPVYARRRRCRSSRG